MTTALDQNKKAIPQTFTKISKRYDLINRILSFGIDSWWRRKLIAALPIHPSIRMLDLATGTGDQIFSIMDRARNIRSAIGIDLSSGMLDLGKAKRNTKHYSHRVSLLEADACNIPLNDSTVDCVTMSFGIRNVPDVTKCLTEMHRVLDERGRALILEFSLPKNALVRAAHLFYLKAILPRIGGLLSGNSYAYSYLSKTIQTFPYGSAFESLLKDTGFQSARSIPLTFGIATLYIAEK